jgi:hypothetical protein
MVWGCIFHDCKLDLITMQGNLTGDQYIKDILQPPTSYKVCPNMLYGIQIRAHDWPRNRSHCFALEVGGYCSWTTRPGVVIHSIGQTRVGFCFMEPTAGWGFGDTKKSADYRIVVAHLTSTSFEGHSCCTLCMHTDYLTSLCFWYSPSYHA